MAVPEAVAVVDIAIVLAANVAKIMRFIILESERAVSVATQFVLLN